jgi:hypothetical protein
MRLTCPGCGHGWESNAQTRSRCGSCGKAVSVPSSARQVGGENGQVVPTATSPGLIAVVLIGAGALMLYHAREADPERQAPGFKAWHWVLGGSVCLASGVVVGAWAIGLIGGE